MNASSVSEDDLHDLDRKLKQLRLDYERYFLGTRPREPVLLRGDVDKLMVLYSNAGIQNTALRFKFNSLCSRYQAFKRQWNETLRQMEAGTYARHRFRASLHERERPAADAAPAAGQGHPGAELFESYRDARLACGQDVARLSPAALERQIDRQLASLKERFGSSARFRFRVVVEEGRAKIKASRQRGAG